MLPPVDGNVLEDNPGFAKLYKSLTTNVLNHDGSSKTDANAERRETIREELKAHRLTATREHILKQALSTASPALPSTSQQTSERAISHRRAKSKPSQPQIKEPASQLPEDLLQLLLLLPPFLDSAKDRSPSELTTLLSSPPLSSFPDLLPQLAVIVSSHLTSEATSLARVLHPSTNPSYIHRSISALPTTTAAVQDRLQTLQLTLEADRASTIAALTSHLDEHVSALALLLTALEAKHGPVATSSTLRATSAASDAQAWALALRKLLLSARGALYPPEARAALLAYRRHLESSKMRLGDAIRVREAELGDYGVDLGAGLGGVVDDDGAEAGLLGGEQGGKERRMREMGRVYTEMERRLKEITKDLERLDRS